ncbi:hypothetical protein E2320_019425, partial [Naja naja]
PGTAPAVFSEAATCRRRLAQPFLSTSGSRHCSRPLADSFGPLLVVAAAAPLAVSLPAFSAAAKAAASFSASSSISSSCCSARSWSVPEGEISGLRPPCPAIRGLPTPRSSSGTWRTPLENVKQSTVAGKHPKV